MKNLVVNKNKIGLVLLILGLVLIDVLIDAGVFSDIIFYLVFAFLLIISLRISRNLLGAASLSLVCLSFILLLFGYKDYAYEVFYWCFIFFAVWILRLKHV